MKEIEHLSEILNQSRRAVFFDFYRRRFVYLSTVPNAYKQPRRTRQ